MLSEFDQNPNKLSCCSGHHTFGRAPAAASALLKGPTMKKIPLTQGKYALVDDSDYDWLMTWKWHAHFDKYNWYAKSSYSFCIKKQSHVHTFSMHRLLMVHPIAPYEVDHLDGDGLNNQKENLRIVTHRLNMKNKRNNQTYPGVRYDARYGTYGARIAIGSKEFWLGSYKRFDDAVLARISAERELERIRVCR